MFFKLHVINFYKNFLNHFFFKSEYHKGTICNFFYCHFTKNNLIQYCEKIYLKDIKMRTQKKDNNL